MATCLIGLGANQGDRAANLAAAVALLAGHPDIHLVEQSRVHASQAAVGGPEQNEFLNSALTCETSLAPAPVLAVLRNIEDQLGRRRQGRWTPRPIDLDLLLYDDLVQTDPNLILPHPRLAFRRFVLEPAAEIAPHFVHATTKFTIAELRTRLERLPRRISITGVSSEHANRLARQATANSNAVLAEDPQLAAITERFATLLASPTSQTAIDLWTLQRQHLRRVRRECATSDAANATEIEDSWIGESGALAKLLLPAEEFEKFEHEWKDEPDADELDRTTLIVVLLEADVDQRIEPLQAEIQRMATLPRQSPWLLLDARDSAWALTELVAAAEAMQQ